MIVCEFEITISQFCYIFNIFNIFNTYCLSHVNKTIANLSTSCCYECSSKRNPYCSNVICSVKNFNSASDSFLILYIKLRVRCT